MVVIYNSCPRLKTFFLIFFYPFLLFFMLFPSISYAFLPLSSLLFCSLMFFLVFPTTYHLAYRFFVAVPHLQPCGQLYPSRLNLSCKVLCAIAHVGAFVSFIDPFCRSPDDGIILSTALDQWRKRPSGCKCFAEATFAWAMFDKCHKMLDPISWCCHKSHHSSPFIFTHRC